MNPASRCNAFIACSTLASILIATPLAAQPLSRQAAAGRDVFFDPRLSNPPGTSCASCHDVKLGWSGNNGSKSGVAQGSTQQSLGTRNTPGIAYVAFMPGFHTKKEEGKVKAVGGLFWDGRVNTLEEQARGALFSPTEMNLANDAELAARLRSAPYVAALRAAFALTDGATDTDWVKAGISAISLFQRSAELMPFDSKYVAVLRGTTQFSPAEARGFKLFADTRKGNCIACHVFNAKSKKPEDHLFTDFTYDNLGLPRNTAIPVSAGTKKFDLGLCGPARERPKAVGVNVCGSFKVPTLRNAAKRPFYFHNGSFTDLAQVVRFYVERDTNPDKWYPKDSKGRVALFNDLPKHYARNVNREEVPYDRKRGQGARLNEAEIADVVTFIKTLDDGFKP